MCTQETPSQLSAQLKAALAKQCTQQAELQAALAREAVLQGTEQDFRLLVQRIIADKEEDGKTREDNLAAAFKALDKQHESFAKLTGDYLQEQVRSRHQAAGLDYLVHACLTIWCHLRCNIRNKLQLCLWHQGELWL